MGKEYYQNAQQRLQIKNRQKKVKSYKLYGQYKKEIATDDKYADDKFAARAQRLVSDPDASNPDASAYASAYERTDRDADAAPERSRAPKPKTKPKKFGAMDAAQKAWSKTKQDADAEKEEARRAAEERRQQIADSQKRRTDESTKLNKRTKRGQPVLSNQVDRLLGLIEKGR